MAVFNANAICFFSQVQKQHSLFHFISLNEEVRKGQNTKTWVAPLDRLPIFFDDLWRFTLDCLDVFGLTICFPVPLLHRRFHHDLSCAQTTGRAASTIRPSGWKTQLAFWSPAQRRGRSGNEDKLCVWLNNHFERWHFVGRPVVQCVVQDLRPLCQIHLAF